MRLARHRARPQLDFNMTPMIDVVFLLLIFFMVSSQISHVNNEPIELPKAAGQEEKEPSHISINIRKNGEISLSGRTVGIGDVTLEVGRALAEHNQDHSQVKLLVRCHRDAPSKTANEITKQLKQLGFVSFPFAVQEDKP